MFRQLFNQNNKNWGLRFVFVSKEKRVSMQRHQFGTKIAKNGPTLGKVTYTRKEVLQTYKNVEDDRRYHITDGKTRVKIRQ